MSIDMSLLHPRFAEKLQELEAQCSVRGLVLGFSTGYRSAAEQDALYAQGRTAPGSIVTNARGGYSQHNWGIAADFFQNIKGKEWEGWFFDTVGPLAESLGLGWGGRWTDFVDRPHLYLPDWGDIPTALINAYGLHGYDAFRATWGGSSGGSSGGGSGNTSYSGKGIGTATCTYNSVRIRTGAGTNYTILDSVNAGTQVEVLEKTGNWYKIVWPGASAGYAYTCADYYTYSGKSSTPAAETYTQVPGDRAYSKNRINYRVHQEKAGWLPHVEDGQTAGITGKALRMEAIKVDCKMSGVKIRAKAHIQSKGTVDYGYITSDTVIGTTGKKLRLEGLELEAEGLPAGMQLYIRYHIQTEGWSDWITGAMAGTAGLGKRLEAIQIKIC